MKILLANKYFYIKGGAENSFFETGRLLEEKGHKVIYFSMQDERNYYDPHEDLFVSNVNYESKRWWDQLKAAGRLLYSWEGRDKLERLIQEEKPDIAHLNNIYHQISPSILHSLKKFQIPTVMTLRDYKVVCASYSLMHEGKICEACAHQQYHQSFIKCCVKNSRAKSLLNTFEMYLHHKILKLYDLVDVFISPSLFLKNKVAEMGFPGKIVHILNFTSLINHEPAFEAEEQCIVYFGRISKEKGIRTLIEAVKTIPHLTLKIIGDGPLKKELEEKVQKEEIFNVRFLGHKNGEELQNEIKRCMFIVVPSEWYENNPRSVIEAFALGKAAVGSRIGGIPELVIDHQTGLTFLMGNVDDLRNKLTYMIENPEQIRVMGEEARRFAETYLNAEIHYEKLMRIYNFVLERTTRHAQFMSAPVKG